jgi:transcriptional regulator with XRE-family HTH domain
MAEHKTHHGRNIKRLREILGMKQEALAIELGSDWSQKKISMLEAKEEVDEKLMEQVARALNVPVKAIEEFDEEATVYNIQNNYEGAQVTSSPVSANYCSFNPIDKIVELYERLLQSEKEKVALLEKMGK